MYCLKPQQPRLSVHSPQGNYSLQTQNNSCRVAISFGWTTPQLFEGKSVTRRCWKDSYGQQFINRWHRGITTYIALDKDRRYGGKEIGWITLTDCPYKEQISEMPQSDLAAEGFPELSQQEFIQQFFKGDDQQQVWVIRFRFTPLTEESCSTGESGKLDIDRDTENVGSSPGEKICSTGIVSKLDIDRDTEDVGSSPGEKICSTGISRNPVSTQLSLVGNEQPLWEVGDRVYYRKDPNRTGTVIKSVKGSTRFFIAWDAGSRSAVEGRNLSALLVSIPLRPQVARGLTAIPVEQRDYRKLLIVDPDYLLEDDGQLTIFSDDEPPEPDDFNSLEAFEQAWAFWELQYPEIAEALARREAQAIPVEQKSHIRVEQPPQPLTIPVEQPSQTEANQPRKTRNTKPGRGSRPKQVNCNVKRNGSKGKAANTYWVYKFSFKVDGKYYDRSCSIPKEKVNRVIQMWESKQYSWRDIVEYIGKNPDTIIEENSNKKEG